MSFFSFIPFGLIWRRAATQPVKLVEPFLSNVTHLDLPDSTNPTGDRRLVDIACLQQRQMAITGHQTLEEVERYTNIAQTAGAPQATLPIQCRQTLGRMW